MYGGDDDVRFYTFQFDGDEHWHADVVCRSSGDLLHTTEAGQTEEDARAAAIDWINSRSSS